MKKRLLFFLFSTGILSFLFHKTAEDALADTSVRFTQEIKPLKFDLPEQTAVADSIEVSRERKVELKKAGMQKDGVTGDNTYLLKEENNLENYMKEDGNGSGKDRVVYDYRYSGKSGGLKIKAPL